MAWTRCFITSSMILMAQSAFAIDPIAWTLTGTLPQQTQFGNHYLVTYTLTSKLPMPMPTPLFVNKETATVNEFVFSDACSGLALSPNQSCNVTVGFTPQTTGVKTADLVLIYGNNTVRLPALTTNTLGATLNSSWVGLIGVDYNPNHYPNGNAFNNHDIFFTDTANSAAVTNTYMEMSQLKAAGFKVIRSYQTVEYAWIDIINQASALGLKVVYEAAIPYNGDNSTITAAVSVLNNVIDAVGLSTFQDTVILVLAGHENYDGSNITYLTNAVTQLKTALTTAGVTTPVSSALVSGNLVTPGNPADMHTLITSYSPSAPLGFDPYPFQWGVTPPDQAASNITLLNSIAWDYAQVQKQSFYVSPRAILMAETGWATAGTGQFANYYCYTQNNCAPGDVNAATYLTAVYHFVATPSNNSGVLVFEAYDEPAKDPVNPTDAENFYGVFDTNCNLKNSNDTNLLPNTSYSPSTNFGCQGYVSGAMLNVVGTQPGSVTNQPPFTVTVTQTNPTTSQAANYSVTVPNQDHTNANIYPWPYFLIYNNASITIAGQTSGASCAVPVTVASGVITFGSVTCTNPSYLVTCSSNVCYLPWNNF